MIKYLLLSIVLLVGCTNQPNSPFREGDKVRDKNGGPTMIVGEYHQNDRIFVYWFDKNDAPQKEWYRISVLVKVEE